MGEPLYSKMPNSEPTDGRIERVASPKIKGGRAKWQGHREEHAPTATPQPQPPNLILPWGLGQGDRLMACRPSSALGTLRPYLSPWGALLDTGTEQHPWPLPT